MSGNTGGNNQHSSEKDMMLGAFRAEIDNLKTGLLKADRLIEDLDSKVDSIDMATRNELAVIRQILKTQTDRITEIMNSSMETTSWILENGKVIHAVEDHEKRVTDLEGNRTFVKGAVWVVGGAITVVGIIPIIISFFKYVAGFFK